jgi:hypothetical protein
MVVRVSAAFAVSGYDLTRDNFGETGSPLQSA